MNKLSVFWFRRDLRLHDNHGFYKALQASKDVLPIFIFDSNIIEHLPKDDARITFIYQSLQAIVDQLGKGLQVYAGKPIEIWKKILDSYDIDTVFLNRDYEPYAQERDKAVYDLLLSRNVAMKGYKDHVIFEKDEILSQSKTPYTVFTPYSKRWRATANIDTFRAYPSQNLLSHVANVPVSFITLEELGFQKSSIEVLPYRLQENLLVQYKEQRNYPALQGTSRLSPHLRFGKVSVREVCREASAWSPAFLNEIIWRDFYAQVLYHFPKVVTENFNSKYKYMKWRNHKEEFDAWCAGQTGYPLVDAGMRELNTTGWMHNRVRMVVASFLCKHLLIDWRWGEAYFAQKLLDFDLASNNGGWQWAAGTGTDAAPYFRVFNPRSQQEKFDSGLQYIKAFIPEYDTSTYPQPIVEHSFARERALATYKRAREQANKE